MRYWISLFFIVYSAFSLADDKTTLYDFRYWSAPDHTRIVIDKEEDTLFNIKSFDDYLVISFDDAEVLSETFSNLFFKDSRIKKVRIKRNKETIKLIVHINNKFSTKHFTLKPNAKYKYHRLVVDVIDSELKITKKITKPEVVTPIQNQKIILVDAGHGGEDPGSIGGKGTYEKRVTLNIAKKLAKLVDGQQGLKSVMIRKGDYYVPHNRKPELARKNKADLLISIHADAFTSSKPSGASVLVQSTRRANSEFTRWIANRQKESELLGGAGETIKKTKDKNLAITLADMKKEYTMGSSYTFAEHVIKQMKKVTKLHKKKPEGLSLAVLKSPDIPSVLIETGFISNHREEKNLNSSAHQQKLAKAIFIAIDNFFTSNPPDGSLYASTKVKEHRITRGESLSVVAQRYKVSIRQLKTANKLKSNVVRIGQTLTIPRAD